MLSPLLLALPILLPQGGGASIQGWEVLPPAPYGATPPRPEEGASGDDGSVSPGGSPSGGDSGGANPNGDTSGGAPYPAGGGAVARPPFGDNPSTAPTVGQGVDRDATVAVSARNGAGAVLDLDHWPTWWRLEREGHLVVGPWPSAPDTGHASALEDGVRPGPRITPGLTQGRIVPALRSVLADDPSPALRSALLLSLARIGDEHPFELGASALQGELLASVADSNQRVSETAILALGILGRPSSLSPLAALLADDEAGRGLVRGHRISERQRTFAAYAIGLVGARTENIDVAHYAGAALLADLERDADATADRRVAALISLASMGTKIAGRDVEVLAQRLLLLMKSRRESIEARAQAPCTLAALWPNLTEGTREKVLRRLLDGSLRRSERDLVRQGCTLALSRIGDRGGSPTSRTIRRRLTELATGGDQRLRALAFVGLAQVATRQAPEEGDGLTRLDPRDATAEAAHFLLRRLGHPRFEDEAWIALALGLLTDGRARLGESRGRDVVPALLEGMRRAPSPTIRSAYAIALGMTGDGSAVEPLADAMEQLDPQRRGLVAEALGMTGSPLAIEPLRALLARSVHEPATLSSTARALAMLHDPELIERLGALRAQAPGTYAGLGLTRALGMTRHPDAAAPLLSELLDPKAPDLARAQAAIGLGWLAQKEPVDWSATLSRGLHYRAAPTTLLGPDRAGVLDLP